MSLYGGMYREIGRRILAGEPGDSTLSVQRSAGLILQLEDMLADKGAQ